MFGIKALVEEIVDVGSRIEASGCLLHNMIDDGQAPYGQAMMEVKASIKTNYHKLGILLSEYECLAMPISMPAQEVRRSVMECGFSSNHHLKERTFNGLLRQVALYTQSINQWLSKNKAKESFLVESLASQLIRYIHGDGAVNDIAYFSLIFFLTAFESDSLPEGLTDLGDTTLCFEATYIMLGHIALLSAFINKNNIPIHKKLRNGFERYPKYDRWLKDAVSQSMDIGARAGIYAEAEESQYDFHSDISENDTEGTDNGLPVIKYADELTAEKGCPICAELLALRQPPIPMV